MSAHRKPTSSKLRPRVRRIAAASTSMLITSVALLGAVGIIPLGGAGTAATPDTARQVADITTPRPSSTPLIPQTPTTTKSSTSLPDGAGSGKRVVFSKSAQRVWLVNAHGVPISTYLVSGSVTDNLRPGRYHVYSRSRWAIGVDDSGVMQYFVRFAHGPQAAIGFHSIPRKKGHALQTLSQLGTPQSHGCIRQRLSDARRMWGFAKDGTTVIVVA